VSSGTVVTPPATQPIDADYWHRLYEMQPASITITRNSKDDFKQRQLVIWLDGQKLGDLLFGEFFTRDVHPGSHTLRVSNTLVWKTHTFDVKSGEQVRFEVINRPGRITYPMLVILGVGPLYVTIRRVT
jgi:hypothetical protein